MLTNEAMFPGVTANEQINLIFQKLGTPKPDLFAHFKEYQELNIKNFIKPKLFTEMSPRINKEMADLLDSMLRVNFFLNYFVVKK